MPLKRKESVSPADILLRKYMSFEGEKDSSGLEKLSSTKIINFSQLKPILNIKLKRERDEQETVH
jgi:hypothetical protein